MSPSVKKFVAYANLYRYFDWITWKIVKENYRGSRRRRKRDVTANNRISRKEGRKETRKRKLEGGSDERRERERERRRRERYFVWGINGASRTNCSFPQIPFTRENPSTVPIFVPAVAFCLPPPPPLPIPPPPSFANSRSLGLLYHPLICMSCFASRPPPSPFLQWSSIRLNGVSRDRLIRSTGIVPRWGRLIILQRG